MVDLTSPGECVPVSPMFLRLEKVLPSWEAMSPCQVLEDSLLVVLEDILLEVLEDSMLILHGPS